MGATGRTCPDRIGCDTGIIAVWGSAETVNNRTSSGAWYVMRCVCALAGRKESAQAEQRQVRAATASCRQLESINGTKKGCDLGRTIRQKWTNVACGAWGRRRDGTKEQQYERGMYACFEVVLFLARERRPRWLWLPEVGSGDGGAAVGWFLLPASAGDAGFWLPELLLESGEGEGPHQRGRGGVTGCVTRRFLGPSTRSGCNEPSRRPTPLTRERRRPRACTRRG